MKISRREFLKLGLVGGAGLALPLGASACSLFPKGGANIETNSSAGNVLKSTANLPEPFTVPLPVPPVAKPVRSANAADYYEIAQKVGHAEILPGMKTEVWGYDSIFPGPTISLRSARNCIPPTRYAAW